MSYVLRPPVDPGMGLLDARAPPPWRDDASGGSQVDDLLDSLLREATPAVAAAPRALVAVPAPPPKAGCSGPMAGGMAIRDQNNAGSGAVGA